MCQRLCGWRETIQRTDDSDRRAVDHVGVDHGGLQTGMAEKRLHLADVIPDDGAGPFADVETRERIRQLGGAIDRLPERERLVIALYYYEGLTFKEIGKVLSVSESRVYQLHTQAVLRMRGYLSRDQDLFRH